MEQDMKTKKFKWPKFLTLKRMVLILLVVCAGIIALVYFCGGYDPAKALQHESVFNKEGFEHYNDALKMETELAEGILEDAKSSSVKLNEKLEEILNASVPVELEGSDLDEWYGVIEDSRFKEELSLYGNYLRKARASLESLKNSYSTTKAVANIQNFLQLSGNCDESFLLVEADVILGEYEYYIQTLKDEVTLKALFDEWEVLERAIMEGANSDQNALDKINEIKAEISNLGYVANEFADKASVLSQMEAYIEQLENETYIKTEKEYTDLNSWVQTVTEKSAKEKVYIHNFDMVDQVYKLYLNRSLEVPEQAEYALESLNAWKKAFDNEKYILYFSVGTTAFKIEEKATGLVWYSNPQESLGASNKTVEQEQMSQLVLSFATSSGSEQKFYSYQHSVSNTSIAGGQKLNPDYQYKIDPENGVLQVYYHLSNTRGYVYTDYPAKIRKSVLEGYFDKETGEFVNGLFNDVEDIIAEAEEKGTYAGTKFENEEEWIAKIKKVIEGFNVESETFGDYYRKLKALFKEPYDLKTRDKENKILEEPYYDYGDASSMTTIIMSRADLLLYEILGFTAQDLQMENAHFEIVNNVVKAEFDVAVEYKLTDTGLSATVVDGSLQEPSIEKENKFLFFKWKTKETKYAITQISVLPYFTSAPNVVEEDSEIPTEGFILIPDGSGAIIEYNNGKNKYYQDKRVYTTDNAFSNQIRDVAKEDLLLPMYAVVTQNTDGGNITSSQGVLAYGNEFEEQLSLSANGSGVIDAFNRAYYSVNYREEQTVKIGVGYYQSNVRKWTLERFHGDVTINYDLISNQEGSVSYSDIAKIYREKLGFTELTDDTNATVLNAEILGLYDFEKYFLGVKYTAYESLTTYKQAGEIVEKLLAMNVGSTKTLDLNVYYLGWRKNGLISKSYQNMTISKKLGSQKTFDEFTSSLESLGVGFYPSVDFGEINKYEETFGKQHYTVRDVSGDFVKKYPYDLATNVYDEKQRAIYSLSPKYYAQFMTNLLSSYQKKVGLNSLSLDTIGSTLTGDYKKEEEFFRDSSKVEQIKSLDMISKYGIESLTLHKPYQYALGYADVVLEAPYSSTLYDIFDYSVPFYQMVMSGVKDYSGIVINANDEKGYAWHMMHILETGSNISFTLSYEDSSALIHTDYNYYYYTQYTKWLEDIEQYSTELAAYGIHNAVLVSHEELGNSHNVFKVVYQDKASYGQPISPSNSIEVYLNYSDAAYTLENGYSIASKDYVVYRNGGMIYA